MENYVGLEVIKRICLRNWTSFMEDISGGDAHLCVYITCNIIVCIIYVYWLNEALFLPPPGERKRLSFLSPDGLPSCSQNVAVNQCSKSPYVEGCSPIRSCSPLHPHHSSRSSSMLQPHLQDKEDLFLSEPLPTMELDSCCPGVRAALGETQGSLPDSERMEQSEPAEDKLRRSCPHPFPKEEEEDEEEEENEGEVEEEEVASGEEFCRLGSLRTGSLSNAESTRMFVSLLAEGSMAPYDVSMQVCMRALN